MQYEVSLQSISWINSLRNNGELTIRPDFQRRAVWMDHERSELMATITRNLPFPEIYINVITDPESGKQEYEVVDGQQRTTSILMFLDNEVPLPARHPFHGDYFQDLSSEAKARLWDYKVVIRILRDATDAEIRELFTILNTNNMVLNEQELRNARYVGEFKQFADRMASNALFQDMRLFSFREVRRMLDVEFAAELAVRQMAGITNKKDALERHFADFEDGVPALADLESEFSTVISLIWSIFDEDNATAYNTHGNFYSLFGCFAEYVRTTRRRTFNQPNRVKASLSQFLGKVRDRKFDKDFPSIAAYHDAVSRASSDKSRRIKRERILWGVLQDIEEAPRTFMPTAYDDNALPGI